MSQGTVNKVIILGRLGNDPDVRSTAAGTTVTTLSVATNHVSRDQQGNQTTSTEWHRCVLFGRMADNAASYLRKGSQVFLEGRLQTNKWQDQNGNDRYTTEIICNEMTFVGGRGDNQGGDQGGYGNQQQNYGGQQQNYGGNQQQNYGGQNQQSRPAPQQQAPRAAAPVAPPPATDFDDDIPF